MQERVIESTVVLLLFAVMASLIQEGILRVQWAHRVNISWTTEVSALFPQDVVPCATWHLYKLRHMHFGKGGDGADNKVWLPKGRDSRQLMREGCTSTYSFPPAGEKALHLFSKYRNLQSLHPALLAPPVPGISRRHFAVWGAMLLLLLLGMCFYTPPRSNQMSPGLCDSPPEKFIGLVYWYNQWFLYNTSFKPSGGAFFLCTFGNICGSPPALWPG